MNKEDFKLFYLNLVSLTDKILSEPEQKIELETDDIKLIIKSIKDIFGVELIYEKISKNKYYLLLKK